MKILFTVCIILAGCSPSVDEFKIGQTKCAEIGRVATAFDPFGQIRCCNNMDCGVIAK